jgi:hypothetical protein
MGNFLEFKINKLLKQQGCVILVTTFTLSRVSGVRGPQTKRSRAIQTVRSWYSSEALLKKTL